MQSRFDVAFDLLDEGVDFLHITIFYINVLHHFWYAGPPTLAGWRLIDRNLGRLHQIAETRDYNLLLMSDHGCGPVDTVFYINTWLEQEGYLHITSSAAASRLSRWGVSRDRLIGLARRSGLAPVLRQLIPRRFQRALPSAGGTFDKAAKAERIDWEQSIAVASGQGPIYLLRSPDNPNYENIREEITGKLNSLRNPITEEPIASQVLRREEVYEGPFFEQAPDLIFEQGRGVHTSGGVGYPEVFHKPEKWSADNVRQGLFLASGPDFASRGLVNGTRIIDLAPTILHVMGLSVPNNVDGKVQTVLLAPESIASQREIIYQPTDELEDKAQIDKDEDEIADRLSALGYLE
jgi:predicted AlkP superfamily phosphohydrolase/phosphomutase